MPGKGLGLVAARNLAPGELIVAEKPVLTYNARGSGGASLPEVLSRQFSVLEAAQQEAVMALHDAHARDGRKTLEGIIFSNAFAREAGVFDAALCLVSSRLNHSCLPNCEQTWDPDSCEVQVRASTGVAAGAELCNYYVDLLAPACDRRRTLQEGYRFECTCRACRGFVAESDRRRRRLREALKRAEGGSTAQPLPARLRASEEALKLYEREGLHLHCHLKVLCRSAFEAALAGGRVEAAAAWLQLACEASRTCHGPGHRDTQWLEERARGLGQTQVRQRQILAAIVCSACVAYAASLARSRASQKSAQPWMS